VVKRVSETEGAGVGSRRRLWVHVPKRARPGFLPWIFGLGTVAALLVGCSLFRSAVNDSPELRWWLFSQFGAGQLCPEMLRRSAPLRLNAGGNVIGRLFPAACQAQIDDSRRTVSLDFSGSGYAWTPLAGRVGFSVHAAVEYRADFSLQDDATYVWARAERLLFAPQFRVDSIQNRLVDWASQQSAAGYLANLFGSQITSNQLASGFTVVRTSEGDSFSLGILQPPQRPAQALHSGGEDRRLVESATTEIRVEQLDFLGPIWIDGSANELFFNYQLNGPAAEALLYARADADRWRESLQRGGVLAAPPMPALFSFALAPGAGQEQRLRMPPGQYVLVIDHSSRVGGINPPYNPLNAVGANPLLLSYRLELGG
jgi:hypothetical protein